MLRYAVLAVLIPAAFAANKNKQQKQESALDKYLEQVHASPAMTTPVSSPGSIWNQSARFSDLAMDLRAKRVGDEVTVLVSENSSAVATGDVKTQRQSSVNSSITALAGVKKATGALANLANANTQTQLQGQGSTTRTATLTATLTAHVVEVLPNGNLLIESVKHIQVNSEDQTITVRGIIRPIDVQNDNTVPSARVGQMELRVNGKGVVADAIRRPNFLYRFILGLLPF
ncbi:MAG TPA: flagellar basal body L-ring protein FlgH [Bryobacteraceae bacterium]|nr:flagellar basal body L-ring protein FlgH [Bryobacteraceae bacterium]